MSTLPAIFSLDILALYLGPTSSAREILSYLNLLSTPGTPQNNQLISLPCGESFTTELQGRDIFASHSVYRPKSPTESRLEAHQSYTDIQFVLEGREEIQISSFPAVETVPFSSDNDIGFYTTSQPISSITLVASSACILTPDILHAPGIRIDDSTDLVRKCVIKIKTRVIEEMGCDVV